MEDLESLLGDRAYDIIVCTGTLMYLTEETASQVVDTMMRHAGKILAISGLADPNVENSTLERDRGYENRTEPLSTISTRW